MATIFDLGILDELTILFGWFFILVVAYGIMEVTDVFKNRTINAIIAVSVTVIIATTSSLFEVIIRMIPWLLVIGIFFLFVLILSQNIGISQSEVLENFGGRGAMWIFLVPLAIVLVISLVGEASNTLEEGEEDQTLSVGRTVADTLTEPKVLGFIVIVLISTLTVAMMSGVPKPA